MINFKSVNTYPGLSTPLKKLEKHLEDMAKDESIEIAYNSDQLQAALAEVESILKNLKKTAKKHPELDVAKEEALAKGIERNLHNLFANLQALSHSNLNASKRAHLVAAAQQDLENALEFVSQM